MDIQQYISSGIIEACVLGNASAEDMRELASLSAQYPEIKKVWDERQIDIEEFATLHATPPPAFLKEKIWAAINDEEKKKTDSNFSNQRESISFQNAKDTKAKLFYKYLVAVSLLFLAGSVAFNFMLWDRNKNIENKFNTLNEEQQKEIDADKAK